MRISLMDRRRISLGWTPGNWVLGDPRARLEHERGALHSSVSASTSTRADPARRKARAQALAVAPVVITSSMTRTFLALDAAGFRLRQLATFRRLWSAESPTWLAVPRTRLSAKQSTKTRARRPTACAGIGIG